MNVERALRLIAGFFVMASVLLAMSVNVNFLWFTLFVGANLFQSAFTGWCPMMSLLQYRQVRAGARAAVQPRTGAGAESS